MSVDGYGVGLVFVNDVVWVVVIVVGGWSSRRKKKEV